MEDRVYFTNLYDYYQSLFTDRQQTYFEEYYFNNLTLQEIAELYNISRNAVSKTVKEVENSLISYEEKLKLYTKSKEIETLIKDINKDIKDRILDLI